MTDRDYLRQLRTATKEEPLRILMSACLSGTQCGFDGSANGVYPSTLKILSYDTAQVIRFCPEEFSFGTPREMCDIHDGNGFDVLDGRARVLSESGDDWTQGMLRAAERMLELAEKMNVELAVMMDISAACGSQVIYRGSRYAENKVYQIGAGVAAALLLRNGFRVISQRDYASLEILYSKLDPSYETDSSRVDHHEIGWYREYFGIVTP